MHLHFEKSTNTKCDCSILSLSWMGKVPDDIPEEEGWKLNRTNYYQEGWLATGNVRGIVGVTFTTSHCKKSVDYPLRTNYNLRGHRSDVILVKWNEPYQKLASCDSSGIIFVWIKYEGRWSVELINDRNTPVTHFSWSHDGRMALICYQDGFVLVGSVAGQRYWSSMLNLDATITCGIWTPDDQQVYFGTTQGQIIVMDVHGAMVSQVQLCSEVGITAMAWSCEKFKMEEGEDTEPGVTNASKRSFVLAVSFQNGYIYLLKSFDDISPCHIHTGMNGTLGFVMEWSNSRELLAVAGSEWVASPEPTDNPPVTSVYNNLLKFYTESGNLLYSAKIPCNTTPVSALTWGHNDKRIFIATGTQVHIAWVSRRVASLQLFCRLQVQSSLSSEAMLPKLPLPGRIKALIGNLFAQTIRCCVPDLKSLREFVSRPPICSTRLHCTMIRHDDEANQSSGTCYTLYLEFLGGLVPLLKGKRTSKIRPEFVIFDPQVDVLTDISSFCAYSSDSTTTTTKSSSASSHSTSGTNGRSDTSESDVDDGCRSPRLSRKRKARTKKRHPSSSDRSPNQNSDSAETNEELAYLDTLPEHVKLVEVTSNIWGTKFKIHGLAKTLPANLGKVTYKTSLLHLQPRQMTLVVTELRDDFPTGPDPNFNPNIFSEDEEEHNQSHTALGGNRKLGEAAPPIAPMSPRPNRFPSRPRRQTPSTLASSSNSRPTLPQLGPLARAESYEDDTDGVDAGEPSRVVATPPRPGISYSSLVSQCSRPSSTSSSQSRVAISPLYCEGSVPTLQSPKNAVAPSDIIFDRPPAGQTTLMSYSSNTDYENNVVQVKNALMSSDHNRANNQSHVNPVPLNLNLNLERIEAKTINNRDPTHSTPGSSKQATPKKQNLKYIDEETPTSAISPVVVIEPSTSNASSNSNSTINKNKHLAPTMKRTPTVVSMAPVTTSGIPESITRSCSVGYLDNIEIVPSDAVLSMMRKETPYKRLVLVDKKRQKKYKRNFDDLKRTRLRQDCKSKSLDSCDILQDLPNLNRDLIDLFRQMPKVSELSENETEYSSSDQIERMRPSVVSGNTAGTSSKRRPAMKFPGVTGPISRTPILNRKEKPKSCSICKAISPTVNSTETVCVKCRKNASAQSSIVVDRENNSVDDQQNHIYVDIVSAKPPQVPPKAKRSILEQYISSAYSNNGELILKDSSSTGAGCSKSLSDKQNNNSSVDTNGTCSTPKSRIRKNFEIVTSFTDSPLFSRRHRSLNRSDSSKLQSENSTPVMSRKAESMDSRKGRKPDESPRRHRRNESCPSSRGENNNVDGPPLQPIEITPVEQKASVSLHAQALTTLENIISRLRDLDEGRLTPPSSPASPRLPRSSPASPAPSKKNKRHQSASPIRHILNSPLLNRRQRKKQPVDVSSDDENQTQTQTTDDSSGGSVGNKQYRDLETFQKAQLRQKLKRGKIEPNGVASSSQPQAPVRREFVMHNKAPMWNENSQVYQLDFGGRVTQESAKNFQIEFRGKQVMQFGRIDGNAYTLDFQYPFSALQAFAVALANVTQRLK
ncbi:tubby-related protein 4-like isoform X1 [Malaya genurostris]|uniref:tubby-related protein 4-like isoform X1 n=1 Tax=Malaya genurostris TaxID=325434 RepID=UPI0026F3A6B8|nr:tubby-related protein 4-like isoform X1 [Malaya genurostris]